MAFLRHSITSLGMATVLASATVQAQQGDAKDKQGVQQIDPIPADKIPPSPYLDLSEALESFQLPDGYVIEPVATGEHVHLAVALSFDANGRAWTAEMRSYMPDLDGNGEQTPNGRIRVLEDTDNDGQIDRSTTFLDGLILPRAVAVTSDGCLYTSGDTLYFIKRNGLKAVGKPVVVDKHYAQGGNPEHKANGLIYGHDNWYYSAKSKRRYRRINGKWISQPTNHRGQWGICKDNAGRLHYNHNSTHLIGDQFSPQFFRGHPHFTPPATTAFTLGSPRVHPIRVTPGVNRAYLKGTLDQEGKLVNVTAACGTHIYRGDNFPPSAQGMAFSCAPSADLVKAIKITRDAHNKPSGHHPYGEKEFLASTDEWFLPCNIYTAPDGTLWILDMYFGLLQHKAFMTSYLRKQYASRGLDKPKPSTGRIYRVRFAEKKATPAPKLEGLSPIKLTRYLFHRNGTIRDIAQRLIVESGNKGKVLIHLDKDAGSPNPHAQIHTLWTLDGLDSLEPGTIKNAVRRNHPDVVNNALDIVARRRISTEELHNMLKALPHDSKTLHSRIRAMAACGLHAEALELTLSHKKIPLTREAFISGIGPEAGKFRTAHPVIEDPALDKLLTKAAAAKPKKATSNGKHLKGDSLASFKRGKKLYTTKAACIACHGANGKGMNTLGPPLVQSDWVTGSPARLTKILLHGMVGPVIVNGTTYAPNAAMPGLAANQSISDQDLADISTYIRNAWGNKASAIGPKHIQKVRSQTNTRSTPYTSQELNQ